MSSLHVSFKSNLGNDGGEKRGPCLVGNNLFIVAEGLGDEGPHEMAEEMVCQTIFKTFFSNLADNHSPKDALISALEAANGEIFNREVNFRQDIAASVSVVFIEDNVMYFTHVGGSRIFAYHKGELTQLTRDHTFIKERPRLEAAVHDPKAGRTITVGIGIHERPEIKVKRFVLSKKDVIVMTTAGLTKRISNREILRLSSKIRNLETLCSRLIDGAQKRGGNRNLTVVAVRYATFTKIQKRMIAAYSCLILLFLSAFGIDALQSRREAPADEQNQTLKTTGEQPAKEESSQLDRKVNSPVEPPPPDPYLPEVEGYQQGAEELDGEIRAFIAGWKAAWGNTARGKGGIEHYISFYSDDFHAKGLDKSGWRRDKESKGGIKSWIRVDVQDIGIGGPAEDGSIEVRFLQQYRSSNYSGKFSKMLVIKKEDSGWKIITEKSR